jgi:hypothetical protein
MPDKRYIKIYSELNHGLILFTGPRPLREIQFVPAGPFIIAGMQSTCGADC